MALQTVYQSAWGSWTPDGGTLPDGSPSGEYTGFIKMRYEDTTATIQDFPYQNFTTWTVDVKLMTSIGQRGPTLTIHPGDTGIYVPPGAALKLNPDGSQAGWSLSTFQRH